MAALKLGNVSIAFDGMTVVDRLDLSVADGEFLAIVGPSGCGKSTLLRVLAGLTPATSGTVEVDGQAVMGPPPRVGLMFQKDTLLPWASVAQNIGVGCELGGLPAEQHSSRVADLMALLRLEGFEKHYPAALSGGMRQRAALGRLLAYDPGVFLMDEPFGALDFQTKIAMGRELLRIWEGSGKTILFVTHDIEEAVALADRVVVMSARPGRITADYPIDLPRPRDLKALRSNPRFGALCEAIWSDLEET